MPRVRDVRRGDLEQRTGGDWPAGGDVLAAAPSLWEPLRELLRGIYL